MNLSKLILSAMIDLRKFSKSRMRLFRRKIFGYIYHINYINLIEKQVSRSADLIMMVLDGAREQNNQHRDILTRELESMGIRLNRKPPDVYFKKKLTGFSRMFNGLSICISVFIVILISLGCDYLTF